MCSSLEADHTHEGAALRVPPVVVAGVNGGEMDSKILRLLVWGLRVALYALRYIYAAKRERAGTVLVLLFAAAQPLIDRSIARYRPANRAGETRGAMPLLYFRVAWLLWTILLTLLPRYRPAWAERSKQMMLASLVVPSAIGVAQLWSRSGRPGGATQ